MIESPDWESPELQGRGREPARRLLIPSSGEESARHTPPADSPWRQSLNGEWRFHLAANPAAAPDDFHQPDYSPAKHLAWAPITVPGNWQLQGYDIPYYTDVQLPFPPDDVPHVPATDNPTGCFRHEFTLPTHWAGRQIFLVFEGVDSAFHLWVNGVAVGFSKDSRVPAEFNITDHIRPGANLVAVRVYRWSDGTFLENQDMWRLSGIYRTVYLWSAPAVHLRSLEVTATLDDACQNGLLTVVAQVARFAPADTGHTLHFQLERAGGEALDQGTWALEFGDEPELRLEFTNTVASPAPWSAESPTRYTLLASVRNPAGALLEIQRCAIGFRTVTIRDGQLCVNGKAILIKGVNRHEHDPVHGHFVDEASMRADLALMKQFNINAVRTAHYPNTPRWYELCDEYGIYLFAEANIECDGALAYLSKDPAWKPAFMARLQRMVACYRNHPSIIVWSLGNESGFGPHHLEMAAWLREADPTRPIHYHPAGDAAQVDILAPMYPSIERIIALAGQADERPIIMCEYAHSMGNATGNFAEYWEAIHAHRRLQGGFIWDWVDQGFRRIAADGQVWYAYGGDFGDVPNDGAFCLNGLVDADRVPRPALWECKKVLEPVTVEPIDLAAGAIRVRNEYHFLDLGHLTGTWSITCGRTVIDRGQLPPLTTAPGERAIVMLPASSEIRLPFEQDAEECWLDVQFQLAEPALWAPAGHVVAHTQLAWPQARTLRSPLAGPSTAMLTLQETATSIVVQGADWQMHFDRQSGLLAPVVHQARMLLLAGPRFTFWRAPTDNDVGTYGTEKMLFAWQDAGLDRLDETIVSVTWQMPSPERAIVTVCSQLAPRPSRERSAWWGWLLEQLHLLLVQCWGPTELQQIAAELGVRFDMPAGAQKSAKVAALIAYLDAEQRGQALVNTVYKWLIETTDPDAFSSMKERLAPWSRMDAATFTTEFALRDQVCFDGRLTYTIHGDGAVHLEAHVAPNGVLPPLPRIGLMLEVPQAFQNFTWYGRGPGENYPDRKQGMPMGIYSGLIDDQFVAYGRPQENGNKSDVRWATLTDDRGNGLRVAGVTPLNVSAHRFTPADLSNARHPHEVVRRERIYFTVDFAHAGLGNASCGPGVLPQYQIQPETVSFDLWIHPVTNGGAASSP